MSIVTQSVGQSVAWTPTWTGFSADPTSVVSRYTLNGKWCTVSLNGTAGTSNATTLTITLPFTAKDRVFINVSAQDNGTVGTGPGRVYTTTSSNILTANKTLAGGAFTGSGTKMVWFTFTYEVE